MLTPPPMPAKKNRIQRFAVIVIAVVIFSAGCAPPGPRALLRGKKLLQRGDYAAAVEQLKTATTLLPANAQAWNYLGVACQNVGQMDDAVMAYKRSLALDRDLMEAHYNLGCLWLEQNQFDSAKIEFTAYTLRRANAPEGWLKLGSAQLRAGDIVPAEKSFSTALYLNPNNAEALNGLGLARIQRGRAREATQFFAAAIEHHPDYAPAILNLATVAQVHLHDNKLALQNYRAYLALSPRPANWDEVNAIVNGLEKPGTMTSTSQQPQYQTPAPTVNEAKPQATNVIRPVAQPHTQPAVAHTNPNPPSHSTTSVQVVKVKPEPVIVPATNKTLATTKPVIEAPPEATTEKPGVWHKLNPANWFGSSGPEKKYSDSGLTPLPPPDSDNDRVTSTPLLPPNETVTTEPDQTVSQKPIKILQPAPSTFPRYLYLSPHKPKSGDRPAASGAFTKARELEQESHWSDAMEYYRRATESDPTWFEAQYNYGVLAYRLQNFSASLAAYEKALAIQPDSVDARYNFALALKAAGYVLDAVNELKKVVESNPDEVRAHLALGNLYAQQLHDNANARRHYLKVLELDPRNPQATDIRFWLSANPA